MFNYLKKVDSLSKVLPALMVFFTRHARYLPEITWSDNSYVYNIFRIFEIIFWRRYGIKAESKSYILGDKIIIENYTLEATLSFFETVLRDKFRFKVVKIYIPVFAFAGNYPVHSPYLFVIALDTTNTGTNTGTSPLTWSHTVTGSNPLIAIGAGAQGSGPSVTAVSYASISATKARADTGNGTVSGIVENSVWLKGSAATGANTVSVTFTGVGACVGGAVSYSGCQSGSAADATGGSSGTTTGAKTFTVTTVADNCWIFASGSIRGSSSPNLSSPTQTSRWSVLFSGNSNAQAGQDNNSAKTPAGSVTFGWTTAGTGTSFCWGITGASFAPVVIATTNSNFLSFM